MSSIEEVAQALQTVLGEQADALGRDSGFIQRQRVLSGSQFAQLLVFGWWSNPEATVEELAQSGATVGVTISGQGLDQRFTASAAHFMESVLKAACDQLIQADEGVHGLLARFSAVYIQDSTCIRLPDSLSDQWPGGGGQCGHQPQAVLKIQVQQEMRRGGLHQVWLQTGREHDQHTKVPISALAEDSLRIADVGYFDLGYFEQLAQRQRYWLSLLKAGTYVSTPTGGRYHIETWLRDTPHDQVEKCVLLGKTKRLPARLVARRLSPDLAAQRRQQLLKEAQREGQTVSAARLVQADWLVYVTNVPATRLTVDEVFRLSRIRWQIELLFKLWKSEGQVDTSRSANPWRILCEVYTKLLVLLIQHWVLLVTCWQFPDRSLTKALHTVRHFAVAVALAWASRPALIQVLTSIARCLAHGCRIFKSRKKPATYQRIFGSGLS